MRPLTHIGKLTWRCGCFACHCLNALLLLLAILQTSIIVLNLAQKEMPIPDKLARIVANRLGPQNLQTYWSSAVFDLRAGILLRDFILTETSTEQIIASASEARLQWSPLHLVFPGVTALRELDASEVSIYVPVSHSPSGLNEPAFSIKHLSLYEDEGYLRIRTLIMQTGDFHVQLEGTAPLSIFAGKSTGGDRSNYYRILQAIRRLPQDIPVMANVEWHMMGYGAHRLNVSCTLPSLSLPQADLSNVLASARMGWSGRGLSIHSAEIIGCLDRISDSLNLPLVGNLDGFEPIPFHADAAQALWNPDQFQFPTALHIALNPRQEGLPFRHLLASLDSSTPKGTVRWIATDPRFFATGNLIPDPSSSSGHFFPRPARIDFSACLPNPAFSDFKPGPAPDRRLVGAKADFLRLDASFDLHQKSLSGTVQADGLVIGQTWFANLQTGLHIDPAGFSLTNAHIRKDHDEIATGSYFQDFSSSHFSLNAAGAIYPSSLDQILADWWLNVFTQIEATRPIPADVTVWGYWRDGASIQSMTYANAYAALYNGMDVPHMEIRVRSNQDWASVELLEADFQEGHLGGTLAIQSGLGEDARWRALLLDLESTAPWAALQKASEVEDLQMLAFQDGNPQVSIHGVVWRWEGDGEPQPAWTKLAIQLSQSTGHCEVQGLTLTGLSLDADVLGGRLNIRPLTGTFAEGIFAGGITFDNWQDPATRIRQYDLELFDAQYGAALEQLSGGLENPDSVQSTLLGTSRNGRLDLDLNLTKTGMPEVTSGHGNLVLRQAEIGEIHLFGGLSRFLDSLGMGFSSWSLDALTLDWRLDNDVLEIQNGLVTGPVLEVALGGTVDLDTRLLDMEANLTLMRGMFGMVVSPVSETLQFDMRGPFENPTWSIRFKPFRWFQNRMVPREKTIDL